MAPIPYLETTRGKMIVSNSQALKMSLGPLGLRSALIFSMFSGPDQSSLQRSRSPALSIMAFHSDRV